MSPYWSFFADTADDLAQDRTRLTQQLAEGLQPVVDVALVAAVPSDEPVEGIVAAIRDARVDALIVAATMAAPPEPTLRVVNQLGPLPLLVWAARRTARLPEPFTHADITRDGATVGTPQLTSLLVRHGRAFDLAVAAVDDAPAMARLHDAVVAASAAGRIRRARIGRVGRPILGYACVDANDARLSEALGAEVVNLTAQDFLTRYETIDARAVETAVDDMSSAYTVPAGLSEEYRPAVRATVALRALVDEYQLDAGAFNCHVPEVRLGTAIGFAPCLALGHCNSAGVPWACTGDVLTAVAMLTAKSLTGAALYHELETCDYTGEFVVANSGEHDLAVGEPPALVGPNPWWPGLCASTSPRPGPATLIAFAQLDSGHRFIAAAGKVTDRRFGDAGTSNGAFAFSTDPAHTAWEAWCRAGANHHSALTPYAVTEQVARVAGHLGQEMLHV